MSLFMPSAALLAIGADSVALLQVREAIGKARVAKFNSDDPDSLSDAIQSLTGKGASAPVDVILADEVVKFFVVDPPVGLTRFSDLETVCSVRFEELFGLDAVDWRISADWHARRRFMASAAPRRLLAAIHAGEHRVRRVEPAFVGSYNSLASTESVQWCVCRYPISVTAASFDGSALQLVRSAMLEADEPVLQWVQREALLANRPLQGVVLMSSVDTDRNARLPAANVRWIEPPRHMQLLSVLRASEEVVA